PCPRLTIALAPGGSCFSNQARERNLNEQLVTVRRQWNDHRLATYHLDDVDDPHWSEMSGGIAAPAPRPFLHGYVWCDGMVNGELAHSCAHGAGPHRIKVCIVKKDNQPASYAALLVKAGPCPPPS